MLHDREPGLRPQSDLGGDTATPNSLEKRVRLVDSLVGLRDRRVLDCGCGAGEYVVAMGLRGADARGIEIDPWKVDAFERVHPGDDRVQVADVEHLPFDDGYFDVVVMNETIEHFPDDRKALQSARRVLKPRGQLVMLAPNRLYPFETHGVYRRTSGTRVSHMTPFVPYIPLTVGRHYFRYWARNYWPLQLRRLVRDEGYEISRTGYLWQTFEGISNHQPRLVAQASPMLAAASRSLEKCPGLRILGVSQWLVASPRPS